MSLSCIRKASDKDFHTEFLDAIIAIKVVKNLDAALQHIAEHSTHHTDAIITEDRGIHTKALSPALLDSP